MLLNSSIKAWALVPARGGSKSIPKKNIVNLHGLKLIEYGIRAAQLSGCFERIVCSTDDEEIALIAEKNGIEVDWRPSELATDDAAIADVARDFLKRNSPNPEILALIQPTSPFVLARHIEALLKEMGRQPACLSGQTITKVAHNSHAWNQREFNDNKVCFKYAEERRSAYNKQLKPQLYSFGNLVAIKPSALLSGSDFFAEPSVGVPIDWPYNLDVDTYDDLRLAEAIINAKLVDIYSS